MRHLLAITVITLLAIGTGCAWISPSSEATSDGIQVHGHWTVTVTNSDGTVDAVHEFDNALIGKRQLIELLIGESILNPDLESIHFPQPHSGWFIRLKTQDQNAQLFCDNGATLENTANLPALVENDKNNGIFYLGAVCTIVKIDSPNATYSIDEVMTTLTTVRYVKQHSDNFNLITQGSPWISTFTEHILSDPIVVYNQQVIAINVTITFE